MYYNYDISVIIPGIRQENFQTLFEHCKFACKKYKYEIIYSGPKSLPESLDKELNVKQIRNFGNPNRAMHMATLIAEGKYFLWLSDDAHLYSESIDQCMDLLLSKNPGKDIIAVRYTEGPDHSGREFPLSYWEAGTHPDLHCKNVDRIWKIPLVMLVSLERYRELGGLDVENYDHLNMSVIDLGFRAQRDGSTVYLSPSQVMNCNFEENRTVESHPVIAAFWQKDRPNFWKMYNEDSIRPIKIDLENWRKAETIWSRRKFI